jgi:hypothetical protein
MQRSRQLGRATGSVFSIGMVAALLAMSAAPPALAQANCEMYGRLALQQMQQNIQGKCNLSGPEWSSDLKAHSTWCSSVGPEQWKVQLQKREQALAACVAKKG